MTRTNRAPDARRIRPEAPRTYGSPVAHRSPAGRDRDHRPAAASTSSPRPRRRTAAQRVGARAAGHRWSLVGWGVGVGVATAATPSVFWWLPAATVHAVGIVLIAAVYLGFAVADGRRHVIPVEATVLSLFVLLAAVAVTGSRWWVVAGLLAHGFKDLWQHRTGFVAGTRWWPPFCVVVDWVAALLLAAALLSGAPLR